MIMLACQFAVIFSSTLGFACELTQGPRAQAMRSSVASVDSDLLGSWILVSSTVDGKLAPLRGRRLEIKAYDDLTIWSEKSERAGLITKYVPEYLMPYPIIRRHENSVKGAGMMMMPPGPRSSGIFALECDTLTFSFGDKLPADLAPGPHCTVDIFRRVRQAEDINQLKGKWELVSLSRDGKYLPTGTSHSLLIDRPDRWTEVVDGKGTSWTIRRTEGTPWPAIEFERRDPKTGQQILWKGIHRRDGDVMTISYGGGPLDGIEPGPGRRVEIYRRAR